MAVCLPAATSAVERENTVHLPAPPAREQFVLAARPGRSTERVHVMTIEPGHTRELEITELPVRKGTVDLSKHPELCAVAILERHGRTGNRSLSLVRGLGLRKGAVASTVAHDSHNLVVAGRDPDDMIAAATELVRCGGGICCAHQGKIVAVLPLPIAGLMASRPLGDMLEDMQKLNLALERLASPQTFFGLLGLALPVIPHYGLTDKGLVDVDRQVFLPIWAGEE
jgi:adenine deaminase